MKRLKNLVFSLFLLVGFVFFLTACGKTKLPKTNYEKVKFAFDGVEKSFKKLKVDSSNKLSKNNIKYLNVNDSTSILDTIKSVYSSGDNQGDIIDEIEYNEPPMIQFQYLKKVLEKTGDNYKFGTKYNDIITGTINMDMETGKEKDGDAYKANYEFNLAIKINIDSNDLINADVSFDINVTQNNKTYSTKWYVCLILDYDMTSTSSNYSLTLINENDEKNLPYRGGYVYEYDYVEVKESKIKEWRKFCYEPDSALVRDDSHTSFNDYVNDGIEFRADTCKWYYNGSLWKITRSDKTKETTLANAFFDLGLNDSDINPAPFFNEASTKNEVIKTCYSEFSKIAKQDIIIDIIDAGEEHSDHDKTPASIKAYVNDTNTVFDGYGIPDITIRQLFDGYDDDNYGRVVVQLWYQDSNGENINQITNYQPIIFKFSYYVEGQQDDFMDVSSYDNFNLIYSNYANNKGITSFDERTFKLQFIDNSTGVTGYAILNYTGDLPGDQKEKFPEELKSLGLPVYDADYDMTNATFSYNSSTKTLTITNSDGSHAIEYVTNLQKSGFNVVTESSTSSVKVFKKDYGSDKELFVTFDMSSSAYTLKAEIKNKEVGPIIPDEDEDDFVFSIVGSMTDWNVEEGIHFDKGDGVYYLTYQFSTNDKFKIAQDNSWDNGGFGYSDISNIGEYTKYFSQADGADDNILVIGNNVGATITITISNGNIGTISISAKGSN